MSSRSEAEGSAVGTTPKHVISTEAVRPHRAAQRRDPCISPLSLALSWSLQPQLLLFLPLQLLLYLPLPLPLPLPLSLYLPLPLLLGRPRLQPWPLDPRHKTGASAPGYASP